jgi:hypothetical protein
MATGWTAGFQFPTGAGDVFLFHSIQIGFGAHPASYLMGIGRFFLGSKTAVA